MLDRPLGGLLGKRTADQLVKQGARTAGDLLRLLPRRYDTWGELTDLRTLTDGEQATVQVQVVRSSARRTRSPRAPAIMEAAVTDGTTTMPVVMFGTIGLMKHHANQLSPGTTALMTGRSMAGSLTRSPPAMLRKTSFWISLNPARFSSTARSMFMRRRSKPVALRCGVA